MDVQIIIDSIDWTEIWMGWRDFEQAVEQNKMKILGDHQYTSVAKEYLGERILAGIGKRPQHQQLNY